MTDPVYSFIWYPDLSLIFFLKELWAKKVPVHAFPPLSKKPKSLESEKSVSIEENWLWFSNSASKIVQNFLSDPYLFFNPYFSNTVLLKISVISRWCAFELPTVESKLYLIYMALSYKYISFVSTHKQKIANLETNF